MTVAGLPARTLTARAFDPAETPWSVDRAALGEVTIEKQTLTVRIEALTEKSLALIRYLGFAPLTGDQSLDDAEREERLKRLKTLGYVD